MIKIFKSVLLLSLGFFSGCKSESLEELALKNSSWVGVELFRVDSNKQAESIVYVDVRSEKERQVSIIEGSLSQSQFEIHYLKNKNKEIKYVAYCTVGHRRGQFAQEMATRGIMVFNMYGGILSWVNAGQKIVDSEGVETYRVHVYGSTWDVLPKEYTGVW